MLVGLIHHPVLARALIAALMGLTVDRIHSMSLYALVSWIMTRVLSCLHRDRWLSPYTIKR